jgi:hypothetical protein
MQVSFQWKKSLYTTPIFLMVASLSDVSEAINILKVDWKFLHANCEFLHNDLVLRQPSLANPTQLLVSDARQWMDDSQASVL